MRGLVRRPALGLVLLVCCSLLALACAGAQKEAKQEPARAEEPIAAPSESAVKVTAPPPPETPPSTESEQKPPPPQGPTAIERVTALCEDHCKKVEGSCKASTVDTCRANCESYVVQAERCPVEVERALGCRRDAEEHVLCSVMVAAGCEPNFAVLRECTAGKRPPLSPDAVAEAEKTKSVDSFAAFESAPLGITVLLPKNAVESGKDETAKVRGEEANIEYFAESLPGASEKPTDRSILKTAIAYLGQACQPKLKLHGRFDKEGSTFVRFDTTCKDATEWHGMFVVHHGRTIAIAARRAPGVAPNFVDLETFLFSVKVKQ